MSDLESAVEGTEPCTGPAPRTRPGRRRLLAASVVACVAAVVATFWWSRSLSAYDDEGRYRVTGRLPAPGTSLLVGLGGRPLEGTVTLVDVTPLVTINSAAAALEVVVCDQPDEGPPGVVEATAEQYCGRPAEVDGYEQSAIQGGEAGPTARDRDGHLVLQITPRRAGTVEVDGVRIAYRDGLRRQTQVLGTGLRFTSS